jgi:hypothetical protein
MLRTIHIFFISASPVYDKLIFGLAGCKAQCSVVSPDVDVDSISGNA